MKNSNLEKLEEILVKINEEEKYYTAALRRTVIAYALLIVFIAAYTTWLTAKLQSEVTPKNVAMLINTSLKESLPTIRNNVRQMMVPAARDLASRTVQSALDMIPAGTKLIQNTVTETVDSMFNRFDQETITPMEEVILRNIDEVLANKDMVSNPELADILSKRVTASLQAELKKVVCNEAFSEIANLKLRLKTLLDTPADKLTFQQQQEKMFIIYWLAMIEKAPLK
ncbi:MAG: hypothetical protein AB7F32_02480 [Victivallaceae bacterium]